MAAVCIWDYFSISYIVLDATISSRKYFLVFSQKFQEQLKSVAKELFFSPKYLEDYDLDKFPMETGFWRKQYSVDNAGII